MEQVPGERRYWIGGRGDTVPAVDAVGAVGYCNVADGVSCTCTGIVVPDSIGRKGTVPGVFVVYVLQWKVEPLRWWVGDWWQQSYGLAGLQAMCIVLLKYE